MTAADGVCRAMPEFQDLRQRIDSLVTQDFGTAAEYATVFDEHRKVYNFGKTWNIDVYASKHRCVRSTTACHGLHSIRSLCHQ